MFRKPFKVKSNTQIKGSERKSLRDLILKKFPTLSEENVDNILPKKDMAFRCKIATASNKQVLVYLVQKRAILFTIDDILYPTLYLLWKFPSIVVTFTTNDFVISKINQGADLMIPGLIRNPAKYENFLGKQAGAVNTCENQAAAAVGCIAMSSTEMLSAQTGKCLLVYHTVGDQLCQMDDMPSLRLPALGKPSWMDYSPESPDDFPALPKPQTNVENPGSEPTTKQESTADVKSESVEETGVITKVTAEETSSVPEAIDNEAGKSDSEVMDDLLETCFLTAVKYSKTLQFPILVSTFYKNEMSSCCPEGQSLDIKKSSYKKVGQFLKHMETLGLIGIKEMKKGVEMIEHVNKDNPKFIHFYAPLCLRPQKPADDKNMDAQNRSVSESYQITKHVSSIFKEFGYNQGDNVTGAEVRKVVTEYVKKHEFQDKERREFVNIASPALKNLFQNEVAVTWEDLIRKIIESMSVCFNVVSGNEDGSWQKGKAPLIMMSTQTRSGNKKVTLVENVDVYNIRLSDFAKECQHGVAASTTICKPPGKKNDLVLIQGNQILFVYKLLTEKYKIPVKYIRGLENAPKKK